MKYLTIAKLTIIACVIWFPLYADTPDPRLEGFRDAPGAIIDNAPASIQNANALDQARLALKENNGVKTAALTNLLDVRKGGFRSLLKYALYGELYKDFISALENARTDKQTGAAARVKHFETPSMEIY